jgi:uncharacterized membrane protein YbhN (UPF0104 family)
MNKLVRLTLTVLLVGFVAWHTDWSAVGRAFAQLQVGYWLAGVAILLLTQLVSAYRWQFFCREMRFERPVIQLAGFYYLGMYFSLVLPTSVGGDVVRAWYLDAGAGRKLAAFGAVFLDRLNGLLVLISICCLGTFLCPLAMPEWIYWTVGGIALSAFAGLALLPLLARWQGPGGKQLQQLHRTVQLRAPRILWITTLLSALVQVANVAIVWLIGLSLGANVPGAFYWVMVPLMSLLMLVPLTVNGMGVREGGVVLLLTPLGVDPGTALALAFLWFANGVTVSLFGGLVYLFGHFPKPQAPADTPDEDVIHEPVDCYPDQGRTGQLDKAA